MPPLFRKCLLICSSILFLANATAWVASENRLFDYVSPYEYPSITPLNVRWSVRSILDGQYEYSRNLQLDTAPDPSRPNLTRGYPLSDATKHFFWIPGVDFRLRTETA